jgi:hypothetical protein
MVAALMERHETELPVARCTVYRAICQTQCWIGRCSRAMSPSSFISKQNANQWIQWVQNVPSSLVDLAGPPSVRKTALMPGAM